MIVLYYVTLGILDDLVYMNVMYFLAVIRNQFRSNVHSSVRPNTEYSAEYSAKTSRIFGTEYSAKSADSR